MSNEMTRLVVNKCTVLTYYLKRNNQLGMIVTVMNVHYDQVSLSRSLISMNSSYIRRRIHCCKIAPSHQWQPYSLWWQHWAQGSAAAPQTEWERKKFAPLWILSLMVLSLIDSASSWSPVFATHAWHWRVIPWTECFAWMVTEDSSSSWPDVCLLNICWSRFAELSVKQTVN